MLLSEDNCELSTQVIVFYFFDERLGNTEPFFLYGRFTNENKAVTLKEFEKGAIK